MNYKECLIEATERNSWYPLYNLSSWKKAKRCRSTGCIFLLSELSNCASPSTYTTQDKKSTVACLDYNVWNDNERLSKQQTPIPKVILTTSDTKSENVVSLPSPKNITKHGNLKNNEMQAHSTEAECPSALLCTRRRILVLLIGIACLC